MPVMKQKSIQPARNIPYAEGILMFNPGADIAANTLVKVAAQAPTGQSLNMTAANVNAADPANGAVPLFITKHAVRVWTRPEQDSTSPPGILSISRTRARAISDPTRGLLIESSVCAWSMTTLRV